MYSVRLKEGAVVRCWDTGLKFEDQAEQQLLQVADLPFIAGFVAAMPDCHLGKGATVGSVIPTIGAVIPAAVGVDIGCGVQALRTPLMAADLPGDLSGLRKALEAAVPHGGPGKVGSWPEGRCPDRVEDGWRDLGVDYNRLPEEVFSATTALSPVHQLGTLGTGNHFLEVCVDRWDSVWLLLHSGSRGIGNRIGQHFIRVAKDLMGKFFIDLPNPDLAYLPEDSKECREYLQAAIWAQRYARINRDLMMAAALEVLRKEIGGFLTAGLEGEGIDCHHNFISEENHFGQEIFVTRKGAVRARKGETVIIPGSMGAATYICLGNGNPDSFESCSHGAGRAMSRGAAKKAFSLEQHQAATAGIECRKDLGVLDETPGAYKPIEAVMAAQQDLVTPINVLKQLICIKG